MTNVINLSNNIEKNNNNTTNNIINNNSPKKDISSLKSNKQNNCTDSIEISDESKSIANQKQTKDIFDKTCSEMGESDQDVLRISINYLMITSIMRDEGINVPPIGLNNSKEDFLPFIDKIKSYAKDIINTGNQEGPFQINNTFLDFCDKLKENLLENN